MNISCRIANADTQCGRITNPPERALCLHKPKSGKAQKKSTSQQVNKSTNALSELAIFRCLISYILYIL